jgi:hypothetical protein
VPLLIVGRGHLEQVLRVYVEHYNAHRPHRALGLQPPDPAVEPTLISKDQPAKSTGATCSADSWTSTDEPVTVQVTAQRSGDSFRSAARSR